MPVYLVEADLAATREGIEESRARAIHTAEVGAGVHYLRTTYLPGDEAVLHLFEAPAAEVLGDAGRRAALQLDRIVEAVEAQQTQQRRSGTSTFLQSQNELTLQSASSTTVQASQIRLNVAGACTAAARAGDTVIAGSIAIGSAHRVHRLRRGFAEMVD